jgi:hypothetical protein
LEKRHEYFRNATDVTAKTGLQGVHWWRLNPLRIPENVAEDELPEYRVRETGLAILTGDRETFEVIQTCFTRNAVNTSPHPEQS